MQIEVMVMVIENDSIDWKQARTGTKE